MSAVAGRQSDRQIRALRGPKPAVDAWRPLGSGVELERRLEATPRKVVVVFLAGRECPFTCVFCDLWRTTLDGETPVGSLPRQIDLALDELADQVEGCTGIKLYNASNFFDPRAVPDEDMGAIVSLVEAFERITVESHPSLVGRRAVELASRIGGDLEVAMGLESIHPRVLPRLNKAMSVSDFERAAAQLESNAIGVRAFVLLGVPFLAAEEQIEWTVRTAERAAAMGAGRISLIPMRGGNGEMERLVSLGEWTPPALEQLEIALENCLGLGGSVVTADTWDLELLASCDTCFEHRRSRLEKMNLSGSLAARVACPDCGWS